MLRAGGKDLETSIGLSNVKGRKTFIIPNDSMTAKVRADDGMLGVWRERLGNLVFWTRQAVRLPIRGLSNLLSTGKFICQSQTSAFSLAVWNRQKEIVIIEMIKINKKTSYLPMKKITNYGNWRNFQK